VKKSDMKRAAVAAQVAAVQVKKERQATARNAAATLPARMHRAHRNTRGKKDTRRLAFIACTMCVICMAFFMSPRVLLWIQVLAGLATGYQVALVLFKVRRAYLGQLNEDDDSDKSKRSVPTTRSNKKTASTSEKPSQHRRAGGLLNLDPAQVSVDPLATCPKEKTVEKVQDGTILFESASMLPNSASSQKSSNMDTSRGQEGAWEMGLPQRPSLLQGQPRGPSPQCAEWAIEMGRVYKQQQATEYRRAVREHLSYHAVLAGYECLAADAADQGANKLSSLLSTPWQILDWEVLSEDDEEEEACLARRQEYRALFRRVSSESAISWARSIAL